MTIELGVAISVAALVLSAIGTFSNLRNRNKNSDSEIATMLAKLGFIENCVNDIRSDVRSQRSELNNHLCKIVALEQRIDALEKRQNSN